MNILSESLKQIGFVLLMVTMLIAGTGHLAFYFTTWQEVVGRGFLSFIGSLVLIEFFPFVDLFLGLKAGFTFWECIYIFYFPFILLVLGSIFLLKSLLFLQAFFDKHKSISLDIVRWIFCIPVCNLCEHLFHLVYQYLVTSLFFYYHETIIPFLLHPYTWFPIQALITFSILYFLIPKFKRTALTILLIIISLSIYLVNNFVDQNVFAAYVIFSQVIAYTVVLLLNSHKMEIEKDN